MRSDHFVSHWRKTSLTLLFIVLCNVLHQAKAIAAAYELESNFSLNSEYRERRSDNVDTSELVEYNFHPALNFSRSLEDTEFRAGLSAHLRRYDDDSFDSNDYDVDIAYQQKFQKSLYKVNAYARRQSTLIEQETAGDGGTNFGSSRDVDAYGLSSSYSYSLTERQSIRFSGSASNRDYEEGDSFDSTFLSGGVTYTYIVTPKLSWILNLSANKFSSEDEGFVYNQGEVLQSARNAFIISSDEEIRLVNILAFLECSRRGFGATIDVNDLYSPILFAQVPAVACNTAVRQENNIDFQRALTGISYNLSENLVAKLEVGVERISRDIVIDFAIDANEDVFFDSTENSESYEATLTYTHENTDYLLSATRRSEALSTGSVESRDDINFSIRHQLSERDGLTATLRWYQEERNNAVTVLNEADRYSASAAYNRRLSERWHASVRYRYFREKYESQFDIDQHGIYLSLGWNPRPLKWRR